MPNDPIYKLLEHHFEDDKNSFSKLEEILKQNGQHMSFFNEKLYKIEAMLKDQNEDTEEYRTKMAEHIARVEPAIKSYEDRQGFLRVGKWVGGIIIALAAFIGALRTTGFGVTIRDIFNKWF